MLNISDIQQTLLSMADSGPFENGLTLLIQLSAIKISSISAYENMFLSVFIALPIMAFLISLPSLINSAEKKSWAILKNADKSSDYKKSLRLWKQAMGLLGLGAAKEFTSIFPAPNKNAKNNLNKKKKASEDLSSTIVDTRTSTRTRTKTRAGEKRQFKTLKVDNKPYNKKIVKKRQPNKAKDFTLPFYIGAEDRYRIDVNIASGGMGKVYGGEDTTLKRKVAVKELFSHLTEDTEQVERFKQEALMLAKLNHKHIVPVYDMLDDGVHFWIVMQWLEGNDLSSLIKKGGMNLQRAVSITADVADALDFAHKQDIIHRDVKPMNVLLDEAGEVKLSDFGTAKLSSSIIKTVEGAVMGSPGYMSPEQAAGQTLDARTDIYSLGVMLYQLLTGELPFKGNTAEVMSQHITQAPPNPQKLNAAIKKSLNKIILKMLAKKPADRYQSMLEVKTALLAMV
ncbi:MAG: serine/threonine protein kinase [Pseudomonadales bacterium]|nr:serine/threonine protein kinase [Pseudomonadales bacterium]